MRRSWIIGIVAGAVVLVLLWYVALFSPTSSDASATKDKVAAEQRNQQELKNDIARLEELSAKAPQQQADLRALQAAIPQNPDLGQFILQANEIASSSGIQWLSISPTPPAASTGGANSTIAVSMQINGGFFQLLDYLNRLEDLDRLVIVDTISATAGGSSGSGASGSSGSASATTSDTGSGDGAPSLSVTLTGRMFTQAAPAASSSGGTATAGGGTTTGTFPNSGGSSGSSSSGSSGSSSSSSNSSTGNS